ncbi:MAG: hypothetical protein ACLQU2_14870 [Candidatus Binataceae bacterium]
MAKRRCVLFYCSGVFDIETSPPLASFLNRARSLILLIVAVVMLILSGCSLMKHAKAKGQPQAQTQTDQSAAADEDEASPEATPTPPSVTVNIGYAHRDDYLDSLNVAKFASATQLSARGLKPGSELVRFEGGEPVWEIAADRGLSGSLLGHMPGVAENKKFALTQVTYGNLPKNFLKSTPENSDPEPLEQGKYYIFTVRRATGTVSYQAVHITDDGTVESYDAQPRAGTSYELCCNVATDFVSTSDSDTGSGTGTPDSGSQYP